MPTIRLAALLASAVVATAMPAAAQTTSQVFVFGDSLSDNGNIPRLTGVTYPPPPYYQGRFSNGPTYAETLPGLLGAPNVTSNNYAVGGALTGTGNNVIPGVTLPGVQTQVASYVASGRRAADDDRFVVFAGANDYFQALATAATLPPRDATFLLQNTVGTATTNLSSSIRQLAATGARTFIVPNLPDLGTTPSFAGGLGAASATQVTFSHNNALAASMASLSRELGVTVILVDTKALFDELRANPQRYGLTNTQAQCLTDPACVGGGTAAQNQNLFWDGVHPTAGVHQIFAAYVASATRAPATLSVPSRLTEITARNFSSDLNARLAALRDGAGGLSVTGNMSGESGAGQSGVDLPRSDKPLSVFASGNYGWGGRDATANDAGFDYDATTFTLGADYRLTPNLVVGGAFGYGRGKADLDDGLGKVTLNSYQAGLYASWFDANWFADLSGGYAWNDYDKISRNSFVAGQSIDADTNGSAWSLGLRGGYVFHLDALSFGPVVGMRYTDYRIDGYSERGLAGLAQGVDAQDFDSLTGSAGMQAAYRFRAEGMEIIPRLSLALEHEFQDGSHTITSRILSQSAVDRSIATAEPDRTYGRISGGVGLRFDQSLTGMLDFDSTVGRSDGEDYALMGKLRVSF